MLINLTLYRQWFEQILAGTKKIEYRDRSERYDKKFQSPFSRSLVKFVNGYGNHRPWLIAEIDHVEMTDDAWEIHLGKIIDSGNLHLLKPD